MNLHKIRKAKINVGGISEGFVKEVVLGLDL